jgi:NAD-dependent dihydropyrimidine dehydrogenase PreA subunit
MAVEIDARRCTGCGSCSAACSLGAIEISGGGAAVDPEVCVECGACVDACSTEAIRCP